MGKMFTEAHRKLKTAIFSFGLPNVPFVVKRISPKWSPFGVAPGDSARMVDILDGVFLVALKTPPVKYPRHFKDVMESGIMTEGAMRVTTPDASYVVEEGDSYQIAPGVWREIEFLAPHNSAITQFHPAFESGSWEVTQDLKNT